MKTNFKDISCHFTLSEVEPFIDISFDDVTCSISCKEKESWLWPTPNEWHYCCALIVARTSVFRGSRRIFWWTTSVYLHQPIPFLYMWPRQHLSGIKLDFRRIRLGPSFVPPIRPSVRSDDVSKWIRTNSSSREKLTTSKLYRCINSSNTRRIKGRVISVLPEAFVCAALISILHRTVLTTKTIASCTSWRSD